MSLLHKLLLSFFVTLAVFSIVISLLATREFATLIHKDRETGVINSVKNSIVENPFIFYTGNKLSIDDWISATTNLEKVTYVGLLDAAGATIHYKYRNGNGQINNSNEIETSTVYVDIDFLDNDLDTQLPFSRVELAIETGRTELLKRILLSMSAVLALSMLIIFPIFLFFSKYISNPIVNLGKKLEKLNPENKHVDLLLNNARNAPKEITKFYNVVNTLLVKISDHTKSLDAKVKNRTNMLSDALLLAQKNDKEKQKLISHLSHDLKTPLSSITNYLELISECIKEEEHTIASQNTDKALVQADRMLCEIQDILKILSTQISDANQTEEVVIKDLLYDVMQSHENLTKNSGNKIIINQEGFEKACLDVSVFRHVMDNLISNSNKHCTSGEISIYIDVSDKNVSVSVSDQGQVISDECLKHFFEPRIDNSSGFTFSGIGLFLCSERLRKIDGSIAAEKVSPKGVKIIFTMPNKGS